MQQYEQHTIPGHAERFAGMGGMGGGLSSSGFGQSLSSAGGNLQSLLAALKSSLDRMQLKALWLNMDGCQEWERPQQSGIGGFLQSWGQSGFPGASEAGSGIANMWQKYFPIIGGAI